MYSEDFLEAHLETIEAEGMYDNDPDDTGGETCLGLTIRDEKNWPGWEIVHKALAGIHRPLRSEYTKDGVPNESAFKLAYRNYIKACTEALQPYRAQLIELSKEPYNRKYWSPVRADEMKGKSMQKNYFRIAVNQGTGTSIKNMYATAGIEVDPDVVRLRKPVPDELINALNPSL